MDKEKKLRIAKGITLILLWVVAAVAVWSALQLWQYTKAHPQSTYEAASYSMMPHEARVKVMMYQRTTKIIELGLLLVLINFILDYIQDPVNHFITPLFNHIKRITSKIEVDDDEEKEDRGS